MWTSEQERERERDGKREQTRKKESVTDFDPLYKRAKMKCLLAHIEVLQTVDQLFHFKIQT